MGANRDRQQYAHAADRGRHAGHPAHPAQVRTCGRAQLTHPARERVQRRGDLRCAGKRHRPRCLQRLQSGTSRRRNRLRSGTSRRRNPGNPEFASPRSGTRTFRCLPSLPRSACFGACPSLPVPACPPDPTRFVLGKLLSPLSGNSHLTLPAEHPACVARNGVNRNAIRRRPLQVRIPSRGRRFRPYRVRGEHRGRCWPAQRRGACLARCCR